MLIDGKAIAADIRASVGVAIAKLPRKPTLAIIVVGDNPVIENFVRIKRGVGEALGVSVREHRYPAAIQGEALEQEVRAIATSMETDGIIVQLPLPSSIDAQAILNSVPPSKDVDMLSSESIASFRRGDAKILPPVAGAIQEILERAGISLAGKEALVLGYGRLVGVPASLLLRHNDAHVTVIDQEIANLGEYTKEADIVVCGVGKSGVLRPEMLKKGVVVIDAGTSEAGGKIVGDADPRCAEVASVFTPVPGGVGPITVAMIFKNLCMLKRQ